MKSIDKILVALDLTSTDDALIKYASFLAEKMKPSQVYFVHNIKKYEISELFQEQLKSLNLEEMISEELEEKVSKFFKAEASTKVLISEDAYTESLVSYIARKYTIDLVMLGNKSKDKGTGVVSEKLMRMLKCDVLSLPENTSYKLENIWTGTDFSRESVKAFKVAENIKDQTNAKITATHIYNVPVQFTPYLDKEEMVPKIEKHTREKFEKFLKRNKIENSEIRIIRGRDTSVAERLSLEAEKAGSDLLVVGDKGGNVFSSLLVGSVTDELFDRSLKIPLWVAK
ncbi:universal stress protein [Christiangramia sp. SM2212]|uniref:Universal stress protein n=1 Tax=Christiangramia sediminicola TaxID=3073267 RepID=A0ABU1ERH6_9FLAO|nr:universal stress protein [Christiangramia sp. SM2212]MDR5590996.1 universal stress protein [Christiangramia sp. SM2212]